MQIARDTIELTHGTGCGRLWQRLSMRRPILLAVRYVHETSLADVGPTLQAAGYRRGVYAARLQITLRYLPPLVRSCVDARRPATHQPLTRQRLRQRRTNCSNFGEAIRRHERI